MKKLTLTNILCLSAVGCCVIIAVVAWIKLDWVVFICALAAGLFGGGFWLEVTKDKDFEDAQQSLVEDEYNLSRKIELLDERLTEMNERARKLEDRLEALSGTVINNIQVNTDEKN